MAETVIVPTGTANIASVIAALRRLGAMPALADSPAAVAGAARVVLPGVGSFGAAMTRLREGGFDAALRQRIEADRPTLCICVGHQLLFEGSAESPGVGGLGVIAATVERFPEGVRVPQFGWNAVRAQAGSAMFEDGHAYFANSFRAREAPGWNVARAGHGGPFVAAVERGRVVGCQFHPELSGDYGAALLGRFLELGR